MLRRQVLVRWLAYCCSLLMLSGCYVSGNVIGSSSYLIAAALSYITLQDGASGGVTMGFTTAVDASSNSVYAVGSSTVAVDGQSLHGAFDLVITKYNSSMVRQWTVQDGTASPTTDLYPTAATVDSLGNLYVVGYLNGKLDAQAQHSLFGYDFFITKYNSSGVRQWTVQDGSTALAYSVAYGVATDSSNNVYVVGTTTGALESQTLHGSYDLFITKYSSAGVRSWTVQDGTASAQVYAQSLVIDSSNNLYITGNTSKSLDGQTLHGTRDLFLTKYSSAGVRAWTVQDGVSLGTSYGISIMQDTSGALYVAGETTVGLDGQTEHGATDFFITKYSNAGVLQWTVQDGVASGNAIPNWAAMDSSNNIYITGYTDTGLDGQSEHGTHDMFLTKYNSSGIRQWTEQDGATGGTTYGQAVAVDALSHVYVVGLTTVGLDGQAQNGGDDSFISQRNTSGQ